MVVTKEFDVTEVAAFIDELDVIDPLTVIASSTTTSVESSDEIVFVIKDPVTLKLSCNSISEESEEEIVFVITVLAVTSPVRFPVTFPVTSPVTLPVCMPVVLPITLPVTLPVMLPSNVPATKVSDPTVHLSVVSFHIRVLLLDDPLLISMPAFCDGAPLVLLLSSKIGSSISTVAVLRMV